MLTYLCTSHPNEIKFLKIEDFDSFGPFANTSAIEILFELSLESDPYPDILFIALQ